MYSRARTTFLALCSDEREGEVLSVARRCAHGEKKEENDVDDLESIRAHISKERHTGCFFKSSSLKSRSRSGEQRVLLFNLAPYPIRA